MTSHLIPLIADLLDIYLSVRTIVKTGEGATHVHVQEVVIINKQTCQREVRHIRDLFTLWLGWAQVTAWEGSHVAG